MVTFSVSLPTPSVTSFGSSYVIGWLAVLCYLASAVCLCVDELIRCACACRCCCPAAAEPQPGVKRKQTVKNKPSSSKSTTNNSPWPWPSPLLLPKPSFWPGAWPFFNLPNPVSLSFSSVPPTYSQTESVVWVIGLYYACCWPKCLINMYRPAMIYHISSVFFLLYYFILSAFHGVYILLL